VEYRRVASPPPAPEPRAQGETSRPQALKPVAADRDVAATAESPTEAPEERAAGMSFVELWSDSEREAALDVERALAAEDGGKATMACDVLITRVLASAAGLGGHADAPRDPSLVPLLLGLDGRRYLAFRSLVRVARMGEAVRMKDALDAYVFALEARRARDATRL